MRLKSWARSANSLPSPATSTRLPKLPSAISWVVRVRFWIGRLTLRAAKIATASASTTSRALESAVLKIILRTAWKAPAIGLCTTTPQPVSSTGLMRASIESS